MLWFCRRVWVTRRLVCALRGGGGEYQDVEIRGGGGADTPPPP